MRPTDKALPGNVSNRRSARDGGASGPYIAFASVPRCDLTPQPIPPSIRESVSPDSPDSDTCQASRAGAMPEWDDPG